MKTFFFAGFLALSSSIFAQKLNLKIDGSNAIQTFQYLSSEKKSNVEVEDILKLPGTTGMLNHDGQFDKQLNRDNFLKEITDTTALTNAFRFKQIRKELTGIQETISLMTDSIASITNRIESNLIPFSNQLHTKPINVYFVLGGNSDGYTTDDSSFFLELQYFGDDIEGIINIVTHEVYHIIQQRSFEQINKISSRLSAADKATFLIAQNIYLEGSATYVANPLTIPNPKKYARFQQEKFERNLDKIKESFYLFDALLTKASSKNADRDLLYNIGYGGEWDSPLYFVGFEICRAIENKYGKYYIKKYLTESPIRMLLDYISLYKKDSGIKHRFSPETEIIIFNLQKTLTKMGISRKGAKPPAVVAKPQCLPAGRQEVHGLFAPAWRLGVKSIADKIGTGFNEAWGTVPLRRRMLFKPNTLPVFARNLKMNFTLDLIQRDKIVGIS